MSDLANVQGTHIDGIMMCKGEVNNVKSSAMLLLTTNLFCSGAAAVTQKLDALLWCKVNLQWCTEHGKLRTPLGPWRRITTAHHLFDAFGRLIMGAARCTFEQERVQKITKYGLKRLPGRTNYEIAREIIIINATEIPPDTLPSERFRGTGPLLPHRQRLLCIT